MQHWGVKAMVAGARRNGPLTAPAIRISLFLLVLLAGCAPRLQLPFEVEVGERAAAEVTRAVRYRLDGEELQGYRGSLPVVIHTAEQNADGFIYIWHYGCIQSPTATSQREVVAQGFAGLETGLLLLEGLELRVQTDDEGRPVKLLNFAELRAVALARLAKLRAGVQALIDQDPARWSRIAPRLEDIERKSNSFAEDKTDLYSQVTRRWIEADYLQDALLLSFVNAEALRLEGQELFVWRRLPGDIFADEGLISVAELDQGEQQAWVEWQAPIDVEFAQKNLAMYRSRGGKRSRVDMAYRNKYASIGNDRFGLFQVDLETGLTQDARLEQRFTTPGTLDQKTFRIRKTPAIDGEATPLRPPGAEACGVNPQADPKAS